MVVTEVEMLAEVKVQWWCLTSRLKSFQRRKFRHLYKHWQKKKRAHIYKLVAKAVVWQW